VSRILGEVQNVRNRDYGVASSAKNGQDFLNAEGLQEVSLRNSAFNKGLDNQSIASGDP
jgi:hypothetical protein